MKNSISKKTVFTFALLLLVFGLSAQTFSPFVLGPNEEDDAFVSLRRTRPIAADYNNDGKMDILYGGQTFTEWHDHAEWQVLSILAKNNGDGTFTMQISNQVPDERKEDDFSESGLPAPTFSFFRFFDYNNDGNLDLIVRGRSGDDSNRSHGIGDYTLLYKNLGAAKGYQFEEVEDTGFKQIADEGCWEGISVGDYNNDGWLDVVMMGWTEEQTGVDRWGEPIIETLRSVYLYKNKGGNGTFERQENVATVQYEPKLTNFKPMSGGAVRFADLDNDGWLDIVSAGYADNHDIPGLTVSNEQEIRIYKNKGDGTFEDVTPFNQIRGCFEASLEIADIDGDGKLDILCFGPGSNSWTPTSLLIMNKGNFNFELKEYETSGIYPVRGVPSVATADLNHDGKMDLVSTSWTNFGEHNDPQPTEELWTKTRVLYQNGGKFVTDYEHGIVNFNGGLVLADFNNDNSPDLFVLGELDGQYARIYYNESAASQSNTPPSAPTNVEAMVIGGMLYIAWEPSTDDVTPQEALVYNLFVKNNATGKVFMLLAADANTGRLKVTQDLQTSIRLNEFALAVDDIEEGYTVGVQAIDQSRLGSAFTRIWTGTGLDKLQLTKVSVETKPNGFFVRASNNEKVVLMDALGRVLAVAQTNELIPVTTKGVYIITVAGKAYKNVLR